MTRYLVLAAAFYAVSASAQEPKPPVAPPPAKEVPDAPPNLAPKSILGTVFRWYEFFAQTPPAEKKAPNTITLRLNLKAVKIAELAKQLKVKLTTVPEGVGDASLTLQIPIEKSDDIASYKAKGHIDLRDLRYGAIGIPQLSSDIDLENGLLKLDNATMKLFDGVAKATLRYPVAGKEPGSLDGSFTNLPLARFGEWGGESKPGEPKKAFPVGGTADGTIKATFPAPDAKGGKTKIDLAVTKGDVTFSGLKADKLTASAEQANGIWNYRVDADALGGKVDISGQYPPGAPMPPVKPGEAPKANLTEDDKLEHAAGAPLADVRIRDVSLPRLLRQFVPNLPASARGLRGRVNLSFVLRQDADGFYLGSGLVRLDGLRVRENEWIREVTGRLRLTKDNIRLTDLRILSGDGVLRGTVSLFRDMMGGPRGEFVLTASGIPLDKFLAPFTDQGSMIPVAIDGTLRGRIGEGGLQAGGILAATRGKILGGAVSDLQVPVRLAYGWQSGRVEFSVSDLSGRLAGGRVQGKAEIRGSTRADLRLETDVKFEGVDVATLASSLDKVTSGQKVSGRLILLSEDVSDDKRYRGTLLASLSEGQALQLPVLSDLTRYLGPGRSTQTRTDAGAIRADLSRGVINIRQFALAGREIDMLLSGKITTSGNLDLQVIATTGADLLNPTALRLAGAPASALLGFALPVNQLATISRIISNRTVVLAVTGTAKTPQIRVQALATLQEAAVRYFLGAAQSRALGVSGLNSLGGLAGLGGGAGGLLP